MPEGAAPARPGLGELYPWDLLREYARTSTHALRVASARRRIREAMASGRRFRVGVSAGKDSTALAVLIAECGGEVRGVAVKDDLDYPGEEAYIRALDIRTNPIDVLRPPVSLRAFLRDERVSLLENLHDRTSELSSRWFYGLLDGHRKADGYDGIFLGLRAEESRGRARNAWSRGPLYTRDDGLTVAQPLLDWTAEDVHAFLATRDVPLLPVYLCVDPGESWQRLRKSWWVVGGGPARRGGHYTWLRRWWPEQWLAACEIDPAVGAIS